VFGATNKGVVLSTRSFVSLGTVYQGLVVVKTGLGVPTRGLDALELSTSGFVLQKET